MIDIRLSELNCNEETSEFGINESDEPYVLVAAVALSPAHPPPAPPGTPPPPPNQTVLNSDVVVYPFTGVDDDDPPRFDTPGHRFAPFWGIGGVPANLFDPDDAIFVVAMMEANSGDPLFVRGGVLIAVGASLLRSVALARAAKVNILMSDVDSARRNPVLSLPFTDDAIGGPQELRFTADELQRAESGESVSKTLVFEGDGGRYTLTFEARNPEWRRWFGIRPGAISVLGRTVTPLLSRDDHIDLFVTDGKERCGVHGGSQHLTGSRGLRRSPMAIGYRRVRA